MEKEQKIRRDSMIRQRVIGIAIIFLLCCIGGTLIAKEEKKKKQREHIKQAGNNNSNNVRLNSDSAVLMQTSSTGPTEEELQATVDKLDAEVRKIKETGVIMESNRESLITTAKLQDATRKLLVKRYGSVEPYRVRIDLEFQPSIPDYEENGSKGSILIEMAPSSLVPHSVYTFMEEAKNWMMGIWMMGAFHRVAGHVLQVTVGFSNPVKHLAFQEYSEKYPHKKGTVGYCGRPSGPCWYVSIQDNTRNHGPGSQQKKNPYEADACFGHIIEGFDDVVVKRITRMPGGPGFINDPTKHVLIKRMTIYVPVSDDAADGYVEWQPPKQSSV